MVVCITNIKTTFGDQETSAIGQSKLREGDIAANLSQEGLWGCLDSA